MKCLFDLLFFLVAAHKRRCRKGDHIYIRASNLLPTAILLVYGCWEHWARQDMVNSPTCAIMTIDQSLHLVRELVPWLVGVNCTRTILLCAIETQRWVFRMFPAGWLSGTQGNTDYRARCTMQVFWHLILKQTLSRATQSLVHYGILFWYLAPKITLSLHHVSPTSLLCNQ